MAKPTCTGTSMVIYNDDNGDGGDDDDNDDGCER
jgi:hypothetical protein